MSLEWRVRDPDEHDAYCPGFGLTEDHTGLCRDQAGYPRQPDPDPLIPPETEVYHRVVECADPGCDFVYVHHWPDQRRRPRSRIGGLVFAIAVTAVFWLTVGFFAGRASAAAPSSPSPEPSFVPVPGATTLSETSEAVAPGGSSAASLVPEVPSAEVQGEPATGGNCPVASSRATGDKGPVEALSVAPSVESITASPAECDLATGGGQIGGGASPSPTPRPTPRPKPAPVARGHVRSGTASWYDDPRKSGLYAAAGPPLRVGDWRGRTVTVSAGGRSFRVVLSDWCACRDRVIDLSPAAFSRLADLSRGLTRVQVSW